MVKVGSSASPVCTAAPRLVELPDQRQGRSEEEMASCEIAVGVYSPSMPGRRFLIGAELGFGAAHPH
jgi:hypothetical protein